MPNDYGERLSRRERQIVDAIYARGGEATVNEVRASLPEAPSGMAVRRMLAILEEKGQLRVRKRGRENVYAPRQSRQRAGRGALQHVLDTFFEGSVEGALAAHLARPGTSVGEDELRRMLQLIESAHARDTEDGTTVWDTAEENEQ